jgi:hypothetical protein
MKQKKMDMCIPIIYNANDNHHQLYHDNKMYFMYSLLDSMLKYNGSFCIVESQKLCKGDNDISLLE